MHKSNLRVNHMVKALLEVIVTSNYAPFNSTVSTQILEFHDKNAYDEFHKIQFKDKERVESATIQRILTRIS